MRGQTGFEGTVPECGADLGKLPRWRYYMVFGVLLPAAIPLWLLHWALSHGLSGPENTDIISHHQLQTAASKRKWKPSVLSQNSYSSLPAGRAPWAWARRRPTTSYHLHISDWLPHTREKSLSPVNCFTCRSVQQVLWHVLLLFWLNSPRISPRLWIQSLLEPNFKRRAATLLG